MTELTADLRTVVSRLIDLQAQRTDIEAEERNLKALVRAQLPAGTRGEVDGHAVIAVTVNRRFNADTAATVPPEALLALCLTSKVDGPTAKKVLPPATYELCMAEVGDPIVKVL